MDMDPVALAYLRRREAAQRVLAAKARDARIARIHLDLAEDYVKRLDAAHIGV